MRYLDLTLPTAAENVALDEALLDAAEASDGPMETLRFWESAVPAVVIGRSSHYGGEVHLDACRADGVPVVRRSSGGAAIVTGPGCLMYALVLSYEKRPDLRPLENAHRFVLGGIVRALATLKPGVRCAGTSDLVFGGGETDSCGSAVAAKKFSGNSVRCRKGHFLYHGTLLYDFPLEKICRYLRTPPRMPEYRGGREHRSFVANLNVPAEEMRRAMMQIWDANETYLDWPREATARLVAEKYSRAEWNESL